MYSAGTNRLGPKWYRQDRDVREGSTERKTNALLFFGLFMTFVVDIHKNLK